MPRILSQSDVADFRERLCVAATRMFDARGPEGFTMRELAAELGVSAMTPYRYFKDKEDILAAVRARAFNRFAEALEEALRVEAQDEHAVYRAYITFAFGEPAAYKLMFDLTQPDENLYPDLVKANSRARATMTDYVRLMIDAGKFEGDAGLIGHVFWAALHGAIVLKLAGQLTPEYDFDRISEEASRVLTNAYRPKRA
ncbi:MAG: TetR/AcrR family transcriptional regulator [Rhizomicrobium sp.]